MKEPNKSIKRKTYVGILGVKIMNINERIAMIENDDKGRCEDILHQLLTLAMDVTGRWYVSDDYTKSIEFDIGNISIFSDPYYGAVQVSETKADNQTIQKLIKETKKRLLQFDEKIEAVRNQAATEVFDKPIVGMEDELC